ncbi:MAG TPA: 30S ribosomal protein S9 [Candidatus Azoamicus sp. OHIO2]
MNDYIYSTGKRKRSIARIFLKNGSGLIYINNLENYFKDSVRSLNIIRKPLKVLNIEKIVDIKITVKGGGLTGQAEAIRHGISKALVKFNTQIKDTKQTVKKTLKDLGFLTRDPRKVERKKVGRRKARKKEQYSKR